MDFDPFEKAKHQEVVLPLSAVKNLRIRKPCGPLRISEVDRSISNLLKVWSAKPSASRVACGIADFPFDVKS
jgi:hypothetical protein